MILRYGSIGQEVKTLQEFLGIYSDGCFGKGTERAVESWQAKNHLNVDGIVGSASWNAMGLCSTDIKEGTYETESGLIIHRHMLPKDEYKTGSNPEFVFLHHTAGWHNPYETVNAWGRDNRGQVGTEFVLGGQSVKGNDDSYDGELIQCMPNGSWGWHLGTGMSYMAKHSVGIEVNNFGWLKDGKTYVGTQAASSQIVTLDKPFRGYKQWHRYSNKQIESLNKWILFIAERDNIDVKDGLPKLIKTLGADAFEFIPEVLRGEKRGLFTHTNVRKDKVDMFPQQELMDMLVSL